MPRRRAIPLGADATAHLAFTGVADGDLRVDGPAEQLRDRRGRVAPLPWTWLDQVHGDRVVTVGGPGDQAGARADAAVTVSRWSVLAVHTADCAPVLLWGTGPGVSAIGAAHAGWRGLHAGVLEATVSAMADLGVEQVRWQLGPCISRAAYEFGDVELDMLVARLGPTLRSTTSDGAPALDLRAGVRAALGRVGALEDDPDGVDRCTATSTDWFSWRARRDRGRQAAVIWMEPVAALEVS